MDSFVSPNLNTLRATLNYEPRELKFGTSGRRGEVIHLTQLEIYINATAELEYLQGLPVETGGILRGDVFYVATDLRPSSSKFDAELGGRGEIAQAIIQAIQDAGMRPVFLGRIPTPALTSFAIQRRKGSIMVTGSHIPFERNGYKVNTSLGELLKKDEAPVNQRVEQVRARIYGQSASESLFNERGMFKSGHRALPRKNDAGRRAYIERYLDFFAGRSLQGRRLVVYEHSAVGREILVEVLQALGAEVIPAGRSSTFVPIDTENIDAVQLEKMRQLVVEATKAHGPVDALVSTDGDSDRPLLIVAEYESEARLAESCRARFFGGDLVGMITAEYLGADAVVVPISCNDALDQGALRDVLEPKTRIGSPHVIAGMEKACAKGCRRVCGWEANGGFLLGSDIEREGRVLRALPTRDALLPLLCVLFASVEKNISIGKLFDLLPRRFSKAALLKNFLRSTSLKMVAHFSPRDEKIKEIHFTAVRVDPRNEDGKPMSVSEEDTRTLNALREGLSKFFRSADGFGVITRINYTDGIRIFFSNGDVAHVRPSGNADELRIYAVADTQGRADMIAEFGVAEPDGILRNMARVVAG
jgi:phosphomannomutase